MSPSKQRLDLTLVELGLVPTRSKAKALVMAGEVLINDVPVTKAGALVDPSAATIRIREQPRYVSRGGIKLEGALEVFGLDVAGRLAIDVGASTGGFTDCLLQRGARRVLAVDVGYGLLAWKLQQDARVRFLDRTNIRYLDAGELGETPDLAVVDVSFISLTKVVTPLSRLLAVGADCLLMIKPQFEVGRDRVGRGVVRDPKLRKEAIDRVISFACGEGFELIRGVDSSLPGPKGNVEFFAWLRWVGGGERKEA